MSIALIGGMNRLHRHYLEEAARLGIELRVFNQAEVHMAAKLKHVDAMVIFTNKVAHAARHRALDIARSRGIPVHMAHSCGLCTLRECLTCLLRQSADPADKTTNQ